MNGIIPITLIETSLTSTLDSTVLERVSLQDYRQISAYLIGQVPVENLLDIDEQNIFHAEKKQKIISKPLSAKKLVIVLKATRLCNLRCSYCHAWAEGPNQTMQFDVMLHTIRKILAIPNINHFEFVWHGGEVTLLNPLFFQKVIWVQQQFKKSEQYITNSMQSNAVNIEEPRNASLLE